MVFAGWEVECTFFFIGIYDNWNQKTEISGGGKLCLKINKVSRNILINMLKIYVYCNFLELFFAFNIYKSYICRVLPFITMELVEYKKGVNGRGSD